MLIGRDKLQSPKIFFSCLITGMGRKLANRVFLALAVAFLSGAPLLAQIPSGFSTTPSFDEEFNGTSLNTSSWYYRGSGYSNNSKCYITSNAVNVSNGYARFSLYTLNGTHYCGVIGSSFEQTFGYWEASIRVNFQQGIADAFWLQSPTIGQTIGNPQQSGVELDIFEQYQTTAIGLDNAMHWNGYTSGIEQSVNNNTIFKSLNDRNFHKFGLAWTPSSYTFYIDGQVVYVASSAQAAISDAPEYVILGAGLVAAAQALCGPTGYGPLGSPRNASMDVDYVRVYPYAASITTTMLSPAANAYVRDGSYAGQNFGGSSTLAVQGGTSGNNQISFLKFDLTGLTGTVQQATLYLTPVTVSQTNTNNAVSYVANNSWAENTVTWNNQPGPSTAVSNGRVYSASTLTNFDVTAYAKSGQVMTVVIAPGTGSGNGAAVTYGSSENASTSYRPMLVVLTIP